MPVRPEEEQAAAAARTEPFEISHEAADRQEEEPQGPSEEEVTAARIQADEVVIEGIRRAEVSPCQLGLVDQRLESWNHERSLQSHRRSRHWAVRDIPEPCRRNLAVSTISFHNLPFCPFCE